MYVFQSLSGSCESIFHLGNLRSQSHGWNPGNKSTETKLILKLLTMWGLVWRRNVVTGIERVLTGLWRSIFIKFTVDGLKESVWIKLVFFFLFHNILWYIKLQKSFIHKTGCFCYRVIVSKRCPREDKRSLRTGLRGCSGRVQHY